MAQGQDLHPALWLQRAVGNQAVLGLLGGVLQAKLAIGAPGDVYEQEAERVAAEVTRTTSLPTVQRPCTCGGIPGPDGECAACRAKRLARQQKPTSSTGPAVAPPIVGQVLQSPGEPLDTATRALFEPHFGRDFSQVRLHTDARAAESAQAVNALAYTVGRDIVFGAGQYSLGTATGRRLLAHELTHVVQQHASSSTAVQRFTIEPAYGPTERGGDAIADAVAPAMPLSPISGTSGAGLQRSAIGTNERILDLGTCEEMACCDVNSCQDDKNGIACSDDLTCPRGSKNKPFSKIKHKFSRHLRCDPECSKRIEPCSDSDQVLALPSARFAKSKCNQSLTLCANGKSTTAAVRERSERNSWEASPGVAAALGVEPDFRASIYPESNDPDMENDRKCTPKPSKATPKETLSPVPKHHVTEQLMRMPEPRLQRSCACGGACPKCQVEQPGHRHGRFQTERIGSGDWGPTEVPPIVREVLRFSGQPIDLATRVFTEPPFGRDFDRVMPRVQRQYSPSISLGVRTSTNYRFDTFQITESDLSDPDITARLQSLTEDQARHYLDRVTDPAVGSYILKLLAKPKTPPKTAKCDTGCAQHWGKDTTCSKWGFRVGEREHAPQCCNSWPFSLEDHARRQLGLSGAASCPVQHEKEIATITFGGNEVQVLCSDTIPNTKVGQTKNPRDCSGKIKIEVIEMSPQAMQDLSGQVTTALHVSVCFSGSKEDLCLHNGPGKASFPEVKHCLTKGCTPEEGTPKLEETGWPKT